jgi:hypothetical protein
MIADGPGVVRVRQLSRRLITVADDAGALLVRSGLVSSNALDDARARVASIGGTLGEQLVSTGAITDDALTDFYRSRLLVPQVNPNTLARLTPKVVATIPSDMAIELRAIPVSIDGDNNLTVAMSDPSDRHAVDEIAFFTGAYIVRAVATQMQIAWCLAHYYGHVTALGQRLLYTSEGASPASPEAAAPQATPRNKSLTGKVNAARHRAAPATGPIEVLRPSSGEIDRGPQAVPGAAAGPPADAPVSAPRLTPAGAAPTPTPPTPISVPIMAPRLAPSSTPAVAPRLTPSSTPAVAPRPSQPRMPLPVSDPDFHTPVIIVVNDDDDDDATPPPALPPRRSAPLIRTTDDGAPDPQRAQSVSGEIRTPVRRAPSIRPPMPEPHADDDDEPLIVIEPGDVSEPRPRPSRRRVVKTDPPELYARAGEVDLKTGGDRSIDADEPRIVIDDDALVTPTSLMARQAARRDPTAPPPAAPDTFEDADTNAVIHGRVLDESQPILLEQPRATPEPLRSTTAVAVPPAPGHAGRAPSHDADLGEVPVVVLEAKKPKPRTRPERRTQVGFPPAPVPVTRARRDTEATGIPSMLAQAPADRVAQVDDDATTLDVNPAPPGDDTTFNQVVAPPPPPGYDESSPHIIAPPPRPAPPRSAAIQQAMIVDDDDGDDHEGADDEGGGPRTSVMSAVELDAAIPERTAESVPEHLSRRRIDYDSVDDGWGPPGTTIPPPLLGAIPGSDDDDDAPSAIPIPDVDSLPLIVGPPSLPVAGDSGGQALVRALEEATARAIEMIRRLERAESRDEVVDIMVSHLAETHHRAGFFVLRPGPSKEVTELSLFTMMPRPAVIPFAVLRLDRPSTLQDVVDTRLPYRGPMHDDASRTFLISILGACPPEILLVPVTVRERIVGVLFGEHRKRHTFDDQLALAARAAGMALERILKAKRG